MPRLSRKILILLVVSLVGGCASSGAARAGKTITSRDVLTREQIDRVRATNAYEAVERLRSNWMRVPPTQMPSQGGAPQVQQNPVLVYLDGYRLGDVGTLRGIEIAAVQYIRYYPPAEASARWGFNHGGGVIYVSTRPLES